MEQAMTDYLVKQQLMSNFDLSIILPFYKKLRSFRKILPLNAPYFQRPGIEVIIVMDEPSEEAGLISLLKQYPDICWKVIVNDIPHSWRPPCKAQNVGIRHAGKNYVLLMDPESECYTDVVLLLSYYNRMYGGCFTTGKVAFTDFDFVAPAAGLTGMEFLSYGSILTEKAYLYDIQGYDESYTQWGGDDDNLRARLNYYGLDTLKIDEAVLLHREEININGHQSRYEQANQNDDDIIKKSICPDHYLANDINWGREFSRIAYNNA